MCKCILEMKTPFCEKPVKESLIKDSDYLLKSFEIGKLPEECKGIGLEFYKLACFIVSSSPANPRQTTALKKLSEAKTYALRSLLFR